MSVESRQQASYNAFGMTLSLLETLLDSNLIPPAFTYIFLAALGAIIGSFLNVVIHRLPLEQSIVFPNSRCPSCGNLITFYDNVPLISYALLRGKCRSCKAGISPRYPLVELLTALLYLVVVWRTGVNAALPFNLIFVSAIVALIFIDAEQMILPNKITYPGIVFSLVARLLIPYLTATPYFDDLIGLNHGLFLGWPLWLSSLAGGLLGALIGGGSLWLMGWTWEKLRGVEAMGLGDVKMMFMVGAFLGWRLTILTIFMGVLSGSVIGVVLMARQPKRDLQMMLPFGIFLGIGAILALLFGHDIVEWYAGQFR